ncbi:MAG: hypothetical protein IPN29_21620 [Saprospiraceae bacterium]|nr:hypothetical protein [Saprospiraceae bacterium]
MADRQRNVSDLYLRYYALDFRERLAFFDQYIKDNPLLDYEERKEIRIDNAIALFEIGRYERFLYQVDAVIEMVVEENVYTHNGDDIFLTLLFKKAAAHYNLGEMEAANQIVVQLIRMDTANRLYKWLHSKIEKNLTIESDQRSTLITVICFATAFSIYLMDIFYIEPFLYRYHEISMLLAEIIFCMGSILLLFRFFKMAKARYF